MAITGTNLIWTVPSTTVPFSASIWFKSPNDTASYRIIYLRNSGSGVVLELYAAGAEVGDPLRPIYNSTPRTDTSAGYTANTWHHALMVWASSSDFRVYLDGGSRGDTNIGSTHTFDQIYIPNTSNNIVCAEYSAWNAALTDAEAVVLANAVSPLLVRPNSLIYHAPLIRDVFDIKGNSLSGSAASVENHPRMIYGEGYINLQTKYPSEIVRTASNTLLFAQNADTTEVSRSAANSILFAQTALNPFVELAAANSLSFVQAEIPWQDVRQSLAFTQTALTPEVVRAIAQEIRFRQLVRARTGNLASGRYRR